MFRAYDYLMRNLIFLIFMCTACGRAPSYQGFESYVKDFETQGARFGAKVTVQTGIAFTNDLPDTVVARCHPEAGEIEVNKSVWEGYGEVYRRVAIFHELGHCELNEKHRPRSIMSAYLLPAKEFEGDADYYFAELFAARQ